MGYTKKVFEGIYADWYRIISANKDADPKLDEYSSIGEPISSLDWQGEGKESVCGIVRDIDSSCQSIYTDVNKNIDKVKTCTGPLFQNLSALKGKYDEYNGLVDAYNAAVAELARKKQDNKEVA